MQHDAIDIPESTREAWQKSVDILADLIDVPTALIVRVCDADQTQVFVASRTQNNAYVQGDLISRHPEGFIETSIRRSELLKVADAEVDPAWKRAAAETKGMLAYMGLPLTWPDGEAFGAICLMDYKANGFSARHERLLEQFQEIINLHLVLLFQQHELRERTKVDALTGACTRRDFFESGGSELKRARRYGIPLSVLLLDFDHFKAINDRHGHACGDAVLRGLTRRIMDSLRASDKYYRFGGEEFVVLLPHSELEDAHLVAERIRVLVEAKPVEFRDVEIPVTVSIGIARLEGAGETLDDLVAKADKALYLAKANGRNRIEIHERLAGLDT